MIRGGLDSATLRDPGSLRLSLRQRQPGVAVPLVSSADVLQLWGVESWECIHSFV